MILLFLFLTNFFYLFILFFIVFYHYGILLNYPLPVILSFFLSSYWLMAITDPGLPHFHTPKRVANFIFPSRMRFAKVTFLTAGTA